MQATAASTTAVTLPPIPTIKSQKQEEFEAFHNRNKHIYKKLVEISRMAKRMGHGTYSINSLFEQLRWHYLVEHNDTQFKMNNNWRSLYARKIMANERDLNGFFVVRTLTSY